jgi:hypothetical protein
MTKLIGSVLLTAMVVASCSTGQTTRSEATASTVADSPAAATPTTIVPSTTTSSVVTTTTSPTPEGSFEDPLPVGDPMLSGFSYSDSGTAWDGFVSGLVEVPSDSGEEAGRCLLLLGTLTPTQIEEGTVTSQFDVPRRSLIVGGGLVDDDVNNCDVDEVESAGYGWVLHAQVTVGTTYPFYAEFFLPATGPTEPEVVVIGNPTSSDALYYAPTVLESIPAP